MTRLPILLLPCLALSACVSGGLTANDRAMLTQMRGHLAQQAASAEQRDNLSMQLIARGPDRLLDDNLASGELRPIGIAFGYGAGDADASLAGITCGGKPESQNIVFGCVPPPAFLFKFAGLYNRAWLSRAGAAKTKDCRIDHEFDAVIKEMDAMTNQMMRQSDRFGIRE